MKVIAAFMVAVSLVLMVACSGGEEDFLILYPSPIVGEDPAENSFEGQASADGVVLTEQGAYHDAIDNTPTVDPVEREAAYFAVARALAESESYLLTPNRDVVFDDRWIDDDVASFTITGIFPDPTGEGEKSAVFTIERNPQGFWYPESVPDFQFTKKEMNQRRDLEKIEEYKAALALLNQISATLLLSESFVESSGEYAHFLVRRFEVELGNPTGDSHEVEYTLEWDENSADPRCVGPENKSGTELVGATSTIPIEVVESKRIGLGFSGKCQDVTVANARVSVTGVDDYERDHVEQQLEKLQSQTSPP